MEFVRNLLAFMSIIATGRAAWRSMGDRDLLMVFVWVISGLLLFAIFSDIGNNNEAIARILSGELEDGLNQLGEDNNN